VQHRGSYQSSADVEQTGAYNFAEILDIGQTGSNPNTGNSASVLQLGDGNEAFIYQEGDAHSASVDGQEGDDNVADISQTGVNQDAGQYVVGDGNEVTQTQSGADNGQRIEIWGDNNTFSAGQHGTGNGLYVNARGTAPGDNTSRSYNSSFTATQTGDNNMIGGSMGGDNNSLTITQDGNNNLVTGGQSRWDAAGFTIDGMDNTATISQMGNGHSAVLSQIGNTNTATVMQSN